jgi:hypothetical protein
MPFPLPLPHSSPIGYWVEQLRLSDVEDALIWVSPENRQILCPFDSLWSKNLAQEIVRLMRNQGD